MYSPNLVLQGVHKFEDFTDLMILASSAKDLLDPQRLFKFSSSLKGLSSFTQKKSEK